MTAAELATRLDAKRVGDTWMARCPAHDDHDPSLAIKDGDKGVVLHCHAGCNQDAVLAALPVEKRDLFADAGMETLPRERMSPIIWRPGSGCTTWWKCSRYSPRPRPRHGVATTSRSSRLPICTRSPRSRHRGW